VHPAQEFLSGLLVVAQSFRVRVDVGVRRRG